MTYRVVLTAQANKDLRCIFEYIAYSLRSVINANQQLGRLERAIMGLQQLPERFRVYEKEPWHARGLRVVAVDNYVAFYIPDSTKGIVTIIRVLYGGQNIAEQLDQYTQYRN